MAEQDPFSKAGRWKVPSRTPDPAPEGDVTRPMPAAAPADDVTRARPVAPADDVTRVRPAQTPEDDVTRPRPVLPPADDVTRARPVQVPLDEVTRARPVPPSADDATRAAPVLPPGEITRVEAGNDAPPEELSQIAQPADPIPAAVPAAPKRTLPWTLLVAAAVLIGAVVYLILGR